MNRGRTSSRHLQLVGAVVFIAIPVAVACGGKVGNLNGDGGASTATPTSTASATATASTTSSAPPPTLPTPLVPCPGQPPPSPARCVVSFNNTIFPYMNNEWACSNANCHGAQGSAEVSTNSPTIDGSDAKAAYLSLSRSSRASTASRTSTRARPTRASPRSSAISPARVRPRCRWRATGLRRPSRRAPSRSKI